MPSSLRRLVVPLCVALVCSIAVAVIVTAANRPTILLTSPSGSTSTSTIEPAVLATGEATVSTRPDLAVITAGVESQQSTAAAAQSDLAAKAGKLIARIKSLGVADKDLSTQGYWLGPNYTGGDQTVTSYRASEQLVVQWHNVDTVGKTLDAIVQEGGATNVGVGFGLADPKPAQAQARAQAIGDARSKAQAMASAAGVKLGQVLRISDVYAQVPLNFSVGAAAAPNATQVPVGELNVSVTVEVDFAIA
jgi:uncharacterized protein YggE